MNSGYCTDGYLIKKFKRIVLILSTINLDKWSQSDFINAKSVKAGGGIIYRMQLRPIEFQVEVSRICPDRIAGKSILTYLIILLHLTSSLAANTGLTLDHLRRSPKINPALSFIYLFSFMYSKNITIYMYKCMKNTKLLEYQGRQNPQVNTKLHMQRSLTLKLINLEKKRSLTLFLKKTHCFPHGYHEALSDKYRKIG